VGSYRGVVARVERDQRATGRAAAAVVTLDPGLRARGDPGPHAMGGRRVCRDRGRRAARGERPSSRAGVARAGRPGPRGRCDDSRPPSAQGGRGTRCVVDDARSRKATDNSRARARLVAVGEGLEVDAATLRAERTRPCSRSRGGGPAASSSPASAHLVGCPQDRRSCYSSASTTDAKASRRRRRGPAAPAGEGATGRKLGAPGAARPWPRGRQKR